MPSRPYLKRTGHGTPWWVYAGLALLLVLDAVLVWIALSSTRATDATDDAAPVSSVAPVSPSATGTPEPDLSVAPVSLLLTAFDASVAYRAVTGECPATPGAIEVTADGGATWTSATLDDASTPIAITAASADEATAVVASAADCAPTTFRTFVQGTDWSPVDAAVPVWRLAGAEAISPAGSASTPCAATPAQVSGATADAAAVLCDDATVALTADGGTTWSPTPPIAGAAAVAMATDATVRVLLAAQNDCAGVQVAALGAGGAPDAPGECVPTDAADGASTIAADADGGLWLWSGAVLARSADGGATW